MKCLEGVACFLQGARCQITVTGVIFDENDVVRVLDVKLDGSQDPAVEVQVEEMRVSMVERYDLTVARRYHAGVRPAATGTFGVWDLGPAFNPLVREFSGSDSHWMTNCESSAMNRHSTWNLRIVVVSAPGRWIRSMNPS